MSDYQKVCLAAAEVLNQRGICILAERLERVADEITRLQMALETERGHREADRNEARKDIEDARSAAREMQLRWRAMHPQSLYLVEWAQRWPWLKEEE